MSVGLRTSPKFQMPSGGATEHGARQWRLLCRRLAREHRRAISQLSAIEFHEYMEWVAEQWDLAAGLTASDVLLRFNHLIQQVASHRAMVIRLRTPPRRPPRAKVVHLP